MMKSINIIYLRVSKTNEKLQDLDSQKDAIINKFKPENPIIYKERGTAYNLEKIKKREEFIKILNLIFENKGVTDIFLQDYEKKQINLYIWDLNRIMRNLKFNLLFSVLSSIFEVRIYSYSDKDLNRKSENTDDEFIKILLATLSAKKAEDYSNDISKNTKKSFIKVSNSSYSRKKGKKVGRKFKNIEGDVINIKSSKEDEIYIFITNLINYYEEHHIKSYYPIIVDKVNKEFGILLSRAYLSKIKQKVIKNS